MKMLKKRILYIVMSAAYAFWLYIITQNIFFNTRSVLAATIGNMLMIIFFIISEKVENYMLAKLIAKKDAGKKLNIFKKIFIFYLSGASFKSGLYFFYIVITVYSAVIAADPDFVIQISSDYLLTVRYGILFLIAFDKFLEQVFKDIKNDEKKLNQESQE